MKILDWIRIEKISDPFNISTSVLNMIRFPDCDTPGFCTSDPDPDRTGFRKNSTGSDMDIQTALIILVKCLIRVFSDINRIGTNICTGLPVRIGPDYSIKILDWIRDEWTVIFSDPDPVLNFSNSVQP